VRPLEIVTLVTAIVGAVCGICGAVLGIINTWSQVSRNRVRLKVVPRVAYMTGGNNVITGDRPSDFQDHLANQGARARWCVEVINLSAFAVTISDVGFGRTNTVRQLFFRPDTSVGKSWPTRLEPREAVTLFAKLGDSPDLDVVREPIAYAKTDCGVVCYGTSPILKKHSASLNQSWEGAKPS
jgi:hypothetical protein